nr:hypothetical protein [uncultured Vibrio sp.]
MVEFIHEFIILALDDQIAVKHERYAEVFVFKPAGVPIVVMPNFDALKFSNTVRVLALALNHIE